MGLFERLERTLENLFERKLLALHDANSPLSLARELVRALRRSEQSSDGQGYVANLYTVHMCPSDHAAWLALGPQMHCELLSILEAEVQNRELLTVGPLRVELYADDDAPAGSPRIEATYEDATLTLEMPAIDLALLGHEADLGPHPAEPEHDAAPAACSPPPAPPAPLEAAPAASSPAGGDLRPSSAAELVGTSGFAEGRTYALDGTAIAWVGRTPDNTLHLPDPQVSRRHAQLRYDGGRWWVSDVQSRNGVQVNGTKVEGETALVDGDELQLGASTLLFRCPLGTSSAHQARATPAGGSLEPPGSLAP